MDDPTDSPSDDFGGSRPRQKREIAVDDRYPSVNEDDARWVKRLRYTHEQAGVDLEKEQDRERYTEARRREKEESIERRERAERNSKRLWFIFNAAVASGCAYAVSRIGNIVEWMRDFLHH